MKICPKCGGIAYYDSYHHAYICNRANCDYWEEKKPTNYERLISKTPEELAKWFAYEERPCPEQWWDEPCPQWEKDDPDCEACWLDWLKSEVSK